MPRQRNWSVPLTVVDKYLTFDLYVGDRATAGDARQAARVVADELPLVMDSRQRVVVGEPTLLG